MIYLDHFKLMIIFLSIGEIVGVVSFNQPRFNSCTAWNGDAITFAANGTLGNRPSAIFIDSNDAIYGADADNSQIIIWYTNNTNKTITMNNSLTTPNSVFVTNQQQIYISTDNTTGDIRQVLNTGATSVAMRVGQICSDIFISLNNTLYCSMRDFHQVVSRSLNDSSETLTIVAGTLCSGSNLDQLSSPNGIYVTDNFSLYVADSGNNRILFFSSVVTNGSFYNEINGTTITFTGISALNSPTGIMLDGDGNLYIVDSGNSRIIRSGPSAAQCLVGCSGSSGSSVSQLSAPQYMAFDSNGNIYVTDQNNGRIQKFVTFDSCVTTMMSTTTTMTAKAGCFPPTVTLIPSSSSISSPIQFRRVQDFTIVSVIQLNCNDSLSISTQWTINNCSSSCRNRISLDSSITTTGSELYIPGRSLQYGLYQINLTVTMAQIPSLTVISTTYVDITPSGITANLIPYGTSMITRGNLQDLKFDPGSYSVDPDDDSFDPSMWNYYYYCRIYGVSKFPRFLSSLITINDMRNDSSNPACLINRTGWRFDNAMNSSFTILSGSLQSNRTYQFMVQMGNRKNSSRQATGYLLVKTVDTRPQMILIGCVIWTLCAPNQEFQLVNPTTQVALFSVCSGNCSTLQNIIWNVYYGEMNSSSNFTNWILSNLTTTYKNIWFFGGNSSNFTATSELFLMNPSKTLWRFEVVYTFLTEKSSSSLNFIINQPPTNGSCSINPLNGTTSTIFHISCPNWFDEDGIKDYTIYGWTNNKKEKMIIGYSEVSIFNVQLPIGDNQTSLLHLFIDIRDEMNCINEINISSVYILFDNEGIDNLLNDISQSKGENTTNSIIHLLASQNQNIVGQILTSVSQQFNQKGIKDIEKVISNGVPIGSISITSLNSLNKISTTNSFNESALKDYEKNLNSRANARDYLITFLQSILITTINSIKLQSSTLSQITQSTNELTRSTLTFASNRCFQLSQKLYLMREKVAYEDVEIASNSLIQCATNLLSAVNGPLQQRTKILEIDSFRATSFPENYDTDIEYEWANLNLFANGNDFSWETIENNRNDYYQRKLSNEITNQMNEIISLLTSTINLNLNIGQNCQIETSQVIMSLETKSNEFFSNSFQQSIGNGQINLPSNFSFYLNETKKVSIRSLMNPLASFGNSKITSNTNVSRTITFSILDENSSEISIKTNENTTIELFIPRDPNLIIPSMIYQNVTSMNSTPHEFLFHFHYLPINFSLSVSIHWEIKVLQRNLSYLFIYRFDQMPQLNSSINQIDGWHIFCPSTLNNENIYQYFLNNQQTIGHEILIYGIRQLNSTEINERCSNSKRNDPPITDIRYNFTNDYLLRVYTSGCYYLDSNNQWKSDGTIVR
ncbi:unnamed protein product [Adineta ricciae]|uniref:PKD/REJ-like domain-containing protein n=1 Tax=Adineta ricciae TaxID=249248 RepID=A0A814I4F3_ADIRI|nr:unnamed protein product [Adineta ricciae]